MALGYLVQMISTTPGTYTKITHDQASISPTTKHDIVSKLNMAKAQRPRSRPRGGVTRVRRGVKQVGAPLP
jgi:hypothetical protein